MLKTITALFNLAGYVVCLVCYLAVMYTLTGCSGTVEPPSPKVPQPAHVEPQEENESPHPVIAQSYATQARNTRRSF
jgi:hypothetical protein